MKPYININSFNQLRNAAFLFGVTIDEMKKAIEANNDYNAVCRFFNKYPVAKLTFGKGMYRR